MHKQLLLNKSQQLIRADYVQLPLLCPTCKKINRISKKFRSPYALMYHLTNVHDRQDEMVSNISIDQVRNVARAITKASEWNILIR